MGGGDRETEGEGERERRERAKRGLEDGKEELGEGERK